MNKKLIFAFVAVGIAGSFMTFVMMKYFASPDMGGNVSRRHEAEIYSCPMHQSVTSDHPGKCPICGMDLQRVDSNVNSAEMTGKPDQSRKPIYYRHPMRGDITSQVPAKDEMGMDFIPIYEEERDAAESSSNVDGRSAFSLSNERQQLIGVTTTKVERQPLNLEIRASGTVAFDPELYASIEEYRQAVSSSSGMKNSTFGMLREQSNELVTAAATKLRLLGLTESQIQKLAQGNKAPTDLILPKGSVWVYAEIFEYEVGNIKIGQTMEVIAPAVRADNFSGKVVGISPVLNPQTRTIRVRALVPDPKSALRPDTFVNVKIKIDLGTKLAVPNDAVLHSGEQTFVFVMKDKGKFEPRAVIPGSVTGIYTEIVSGLQEGETIVTSANFLIDSESRLRAAVHNTATPKAQEKPSGVKP